MLRWLERNWVWVTAAVFPAALAALLLTPQDSLGRAAWLAWANPLAYFLHQIEEHGWPGGFKRFANERVFGVRGRDCPFDDRVLLFINVPLTWLLYPLAACVLPSAPLAAATCFAITLLNGALHMLVCIRFPFWTPGLVTGATLLAPLGLAGWLAIHERLGVAEVAAAWAIAVVGHAAIVATAFWRLRRDRGRG